MTPPYIGTYIGTYLNSNWGHFLFRTASLNQLVALAKLQPVSECPDAAKLCFDRRFFNTKILDTNQGNIKGFLKLNLVVKTLN